MQGIKYNNIWNVVAEGFTIIRNLYASFVGLSTTSCDNTTTVCDIAAFSCVCSWPMTGS